jgi:hypothetical protein
MTDLREWSSDSGDRLVAGEHAAHLRPAVAVRDLGRRFWHAGPWMVPRHVS